MNKDNVVAPFFMAHLANSFKERKAFNVADRAADFHNDYVHALRHLGDAGFDFVGYVGDDLNGFAEVIAAAFALNDRFVDTATG